MSKDNERLDWVDAARGVGIGLVVFGHVWRGLWQADLLSVAPLFAAIDAAIYLFHMPLFFLVSGLFFETSVRRDGAGRSIIKRCETLLYPLLIWSWITAAFLFFAGSVTTREALTLNEVLLYPFTLQDIFWFLWVLFLIQVFCTLLVRASTSVLAAFLLLSFATAVLLPMVSSVELLHGAAANLPFFLAGVLLQRLDLLGLRQTRLTGWVGAGFFLSSLCGAVVFGLQPAPLGTILSLVAALGCCAAIYGFAPPAPAKAMAVMTYLGARSMAIYVMHVIPSAGARIVLVRFGFESVWLHVFLGTLAGLLLPVVAYEVLKRLALLRIFGLGRDRRQGSPVLSAH